MFRLRGSRHTGERGITPKLIMKLSDPDFRERFEAFPRETAEAAGFNLSDEELDQLATKLRQEESSFGG
jgi:hypothetical protein